MPKSRPNIQQYRLAASWRSLSAAGWVAATLTIVLLWGFVRPFGLLQKADWIVQDKFLQSRPPPPVDPKLLQVSWDDYTALQYGEINQRHRLARVIGQLERLGAKSVLIDVLLLDRGSTDSFYRDEAKYDGVPNQIVHASSVPLAKSVQNRYLEDHLLEESLQAAKKIVIPFSLVEPSTNDDRAVRAIVKRLESKIFYTFDDFAQELRTETFVDLPQELRTDLNKAALLFESACDFAADRAAGNPVMRKIADRLEQNPIPSDILVAEKLLTSDDIAKELKLDIKTTARWYDAALALAADRLAHDPDPVLLKMVDRLKQDLNQDRELTSAADLANELNISVETAPKRYTLALTMAADNSAGLEFPLFSPVTERIGRAFDRRIVLDRLAADGTILLPRNRPIRETGEPNVPLNGFASAAALGFADFEPDADDTFRRVPLLAQWRNRGLAHQSLVVVSRYLGVELSDVRIDGNAIHLGSDNIVPVDSKGRLSINWPMNDISSWNDDLDHRLPAAVFFKLAEYDADIEQNRFNLRLSVTQLVNELELDIGDDNKCDMLSNEIYLDYFAGRIESAQEKEQRFDKEYVPTSLDLESARIELEMAKDGDSEKPKPANLITTIARAILSLQNESFDSEETDLRKTARIIAQEIVALQKDFPRLEAERITEVQKIRKRVEGKLCLIGDTSTGSSDLKNTPVGPRVPGVTINFAAINTMLTQRYLTVPRIWVSALLTLSLGVLFSWVFLRFHALAAFSAAVVGLPLIAVGHYQALVRADILISPVLPMVGVSLCYLTTATRRWWLDAEEKRKIRHAFQHYLHPVIVDKVSRNPKLLRLGGEDAELSVLFSDIRGFSKVSEELSVEQLQKLLNEFLTPMTEIIFDHNGTLDKYIGDAMMAFFGAPLPSNNHAFEACRAALAMNGRLSELQQIWRNQGLPPINIGIGVNTDVVHVGNFGSKVRFDYTVIGDGVNLASRLEGATKQYGVDILISESTYKHLDGQIVTRELDLIRVVGKQEPTRIFEVVGLPEPENNRQSFLDRFQAGIDAHRSQQWTTAIDHFQQVLDAVPDDTPSKIYIERCEAFMANPPPSDWDGVYTMLTK